MADALEVAGAPVIRVNGGLNLAVELAREKAQEGDVVLLAPACSSFDEFANYEARGRRFTLLARQEAA